MSDKEKIQLIADKIKPLLLFIDGLSEALSEEEYKLLIKSKTTLINHISFRQSAITLAAAFNIETDTTEEEYKVKTLEVLIMLLEVRKEYKQVMIENKKKKAELDKNRSKLLKIFGNL